VVELVGEDHAVRHQPRDGGDCGFVGHEPRREHQRRFLAVEIGERTLEFDQRMRGARNVARTAGAGAEPGGGICHRGDHCPMLPHPKIVVRAPHRDLTGIARLVAIDRAGKIAGNALEIGEHPIALLRAKRIDGILEESAIVHG
jgi:hypothetical protein